MNGTSGRQHSDTQITRTSSQTHALKSAHTHTQIQTHTPTHKYRHTHTHTKAWQVCVSSSKVVWLQPLCLSKQCFELRIWKKKFMLLSLVLLSPTLSIHIYLTAKDTEKHTKTHTRTQTICIHTLWEPRNDSPVHRLPLISVNGRLSPLILGPFFWLLSKLIFEQIPQAVSEVCT